MASCNWIFTCNPKSTVETVIVWLDTQKINVLQVEFSLEMEAFWKELFSIAWGLLVGFERSVVTTREVIKSRSVWLGLWILA